ncbi:TrkH family potassium uptake protein [Rhodohalobacter sp. 614A]|uniref:TrkH family potassium uptake protein n=1 Tax=Rhodohalobacter sp. 614A TaxID=2908649 RepID=UPI001F1E2112|nr:potassium transporter TrkG [Rhodohalobacter sp. 614A]
MKIASNKFIENASAGKLILLGYLLILLAGFILLSLPFSVSTTVTSLDHFFIATSALSTTGLVSVGISENYSFFGELVILLLIQLGGIGYMSLGSFIILGSKRRISKTGVKLLEFDFSLPKGFSILHFVKNVIWFSLLIELAGAIFLYFIFLNQDVSNPIWNAIFHSISAFCTAGFSLFNTSFEAFKDHFWLNLVISALSFSGAIGFIVFSDVYERLAGRKKQITYTSRIILRFTIIMIAFGTVILFVSDSNLLQYPAWERLMVAAFQSMTALTTVGFNTFPIQDLLGASIFLIIMLMLMGASPSGTGGGIKSTTMTALYAEVISTLRGKKKVTYLGRIIPSHRIKMASSNFFFYTFILTCGIFLLLLTESHPVFDTIFEATSALGTVGLSTGITGSLSPLGKVIIIILMFLGRIGPLSIGVALMTVTDEDAIESEQDIAI